jgi:serine/threonine protein kinase
MNQFISLETPGAAPDPDPRLRPRLEEHVAAQYTIEHELGGGGMSRVFVGLDRTLNRRVAIKVLPPSLAASLSANRFRREIMVSAGLQHPHIVPVLSASELDGIPYFVMPFIEGESLRARHARGPLSVREKVPNLRDVARALAFAHRAGVVHRDIKPDNILLAQGSAVVTDFGVAKAVVDSRAATPNSGSTTITAVGVSLGTPAYMAPEQAAADPRVDHRADLYALGVVAYEMLAGSPPFGGRRSTDLLRAHLTEKPAPLRTKRSDVPAALDRAIMRCLEKDPDDRFASATEVVQALESPEAISGELGAITVPPDRRRRLVVGALLGVAALVLTVVLVRRARPVANGASTVVIDVVPFQSRTQGSDSTLTRDVFADLIGALRTIPGVVVREGAIGDLGTPDSASGRSLVLRGTLQQSGDRLRTNARLSTAASDSTLWSGRFEGTTADILGFEDRLAQATIAGIRAAQRSR